MLTALTLIALAGSVTHTPACPDTQRYAEPPPPVADPAPPPKPRRSWVMVSCPPGPNLRIWTPREKNRAHRWPYHRKSTPYAGKELGILALFPRQGSAYRLVQPTVWLSSFFGWNLNPFVGLEVSLGGTPLRERENGLGDVRHAGLAAVGLDLRVRLVMPAPDNPIVPYLQAGLGGYFFGGTRRDPDGCEGRACLLATGGGAHAGAGLDLYLFRGAILGVRVMYRHLFLSSLRCPPGSTCAALTGDAKRTEVPSLSATLHFTIFWSHR